LTTKECKSLKKAFFITLFIISTLPAFAEEGLFNLASVDRDLYRNRERTVLAPALHEKLEYYEITGSAEKDLREQMTRRGIAWSDGKKYDSVTSWRVEWGYEHDRSMQSCGAEAFQASVEITTRYPRWIRTGDAPRELVDKWEGYLANLVLHEEGHRDMLVEAIEDITRSVARMPGAPNCAELDRLVRSLCHERMAKLNDEAKEYDVATLHGSVQGAVFP
jgi:predicted secreted Zn-dependent protease